MSPDTISENVPSKKPSESSGKSFTSPKSKSNVEKHHGNSSTPPELKRNEATARAKPIQQVSDRKNDNAESSRQAVGDDDDPCKKKTKKVEVPPVVIEKFKRTPGLDPRFQQQNQTLRCFVMYTDFYRCEKILGEGHEACTWFHDVFTSICPNAWIQRWDELRSEGRMPWNRGRVQGKFPGDRYGS